MVILQRTENWFFYRGICQNHANPEMRRIGELTDLQIRARVRCEPRDTTIKGAVVSGPDSDAVKRIEKSVDFLGWAHDDPNLGASISWDVGDPIRIIPLKQDKLSEAVYGVVHAIDGSPETSCVLPDVRVGELVVYRAGTYLLVDNANVLKPRVPTDKPVNRAEYIALHGTTQDA
jgi:hypothetical protein